MSIKNIIALLLSTTFLLANDTSLSSSDIEKINVDGYVIKKDFDKGEGFISFDVNRSIDDVFADILDLKKYPDEISDVEKVEIYKKNDYEVRAKLYISTFFVDFHNSVTHKINKNNHEVTWSLDEEFDETNYFSKMIGFWKLEKIKNKTRIFYSNNLEFKSWVPGFLKSYIFEKGLTESTFWLKK